MARAQARPPQPRPRARLPQAALHLREARPGCGRLRAPLQQFAVQDARPVHAAQLQLGFDVEPEQLRLGAHPQRPPQQPPGAPQVARPQLRLGCGHPQFGEGEACVWHGAQGRRVHRPRPLRAPRVHLLPQRVLEPEVDVAAPGALRVGRVVGRGVRDGALVPLPHRPGVAPLLQPAQQVEPGVVVERVGRDARLVRRPALGQHNRLDGAPVAVLALERRVRGHNPAAGPLRQPVERVAVDGAGAVPLLAQGLKLGKAQEHLLRPALPLQRPHRPLVHLAAARPVARAGRLELGVAQPGLGHRVAGDVALKHGPRVANLPVPQLQLHVRRPRRVVRLPRQPAVEQLPGGGHSPQHLLHVDVLVPQHVVARQQRHSPVPHVARRVHVAGLHLHLCVPHPQRRAAVLHVQRALVHRPRARQVALRLLPRSVLRPRARVPAHLGG